MNFNDFTQKLEEVGTKALTKGKATKDIIALKAQINSCEDVINRAYSAIGRKYYEANPEALEGSFAAKEITDIKNALNAIKELEAKIEDIRSNS